jgi:hypothetical protein
VIAIWSSSGSRSDGHTCIKVKFANKMSV